MVWRMLETMAIPQDSILLLHSAFKGFKRDGYDLGAVLHALMDYMKPGTLLLPTMSWRYVKKDNPLFDELETPCNTGILAETFRRDFSVRRSLHPLHSVAGIGKAVDEVLNGHHLDETPCSENSPFGRIVEHDGYIVMFGISMDCCTLIHHVEEMVAPDLYLYSREHTEEYQCRDRHGVSRNVRLRRHLFLPRDYWQFQDKLAVDKKLGIFRCDNSICRGFRARDIYATVEETLNAEPGAIIAKPGQRYRMM